MKFFADDEYYHTFVYYDPIHGVPLDGRTKIITLELSKLDEIAEKPINKMTVSEKWAVFMEYLTDKGKRDKINEIVEQEEGIAMAGQVLITVSKDERERALLESEYKYHVDLQSKLVTAKREGISEGLSKGKLEEKLEIARNALVAGASYDFIKKITGLDTETIENLH